MSRAFFGGVHFDDHKSATNRKPIENLPAPKQVIIPMSMHIGAQCTPVVKKGDTVKMGELIGSSEAAMSAPVHASVSGTVSAVEPRLHPNGTMVMSVVIDNDFLDTPDNTLKKYSSIDDLTPEDILNIVKDAGIVGHGGATFPTHFKISSGLGKVDTIIINAAECEPYITSDHRIMLEHTQEVVDGIRLLIKAFSLSKAYVGIELNKKNAIESIRALSGNDIIVKPLKTRYPQGAEKQLIQAVTKRQVPSGGLPADVGCAVFNVDTAAAVARAVYSGTPVIRRIVTVSGSAVKDPKNLNVRIGTPLRDLFDFCGGFVDKPSKVIMGGPMMGVAQYSIDVPIYKGTIAILAFCKNEDKTSTFPTCIKCGKCVGVCPMKLMPVNLNQYANKNNFEMLKEYGITDCMECGSCAYICPARIPLVQTFKMAKQKLADYNKQLKEKEASI